MKPLLISILLLGCSGPAFTETNEERINPTDTAGGSGESPISRGGGLQGGSGGAGVAGAESVAGNETGSPPTSGSSGATAVAGGPPMGEGGSGGVSSESREPAECLANHQTLECARVCNSSPYCQGILDCFVSTNSDLTSDCPGFSDTGYSLAAQAVRNCCHD